MSGEGGAGVRGHRCGVPRCDGTRLGHDLAVDFPEETRQIDEALDGLRTPTAHSGGQGAGQAGGER